LQHIRVLFQALALYEVGLEHRLVVKRHRSEAGSLEEEVETLLLRLRNSLWLTARNSKSSSTGLFLNLKGLFSCGEGLFVGFHDCFSDLIILSERLGHALWNAFAFRKRSWELRLYQ
jgi:hypothetical protein